MANLDQITSYLGDVFGEQIQTETNSASVGTSAVNVVSISLPPGIWLAVCECSFGTSTSGRRFIGFSDTSATASENRVQISPVSGGATIAQSIGIAVNSTSSNKTFYLVAACSGISSAITATGAITAIRIK